MYIGEKMGLVYKNAYQIQSNLSVNTNGLVLEDDPPALLSFTLAESRVALIIYSACVYHPLEVGWAESSNHGPKLAIMIDGADSAETDSSGEGGTGVSRPMAGGTVLWVGTLAAGAHTIKGRYCSVQGIQRLHNRRLTVLLFEGTAADFVYVRSQVQVNTNLAVLQNDAQAIINLNLPETQKALILYGACNFQGILEGTHGKSIAISTDGADGLEMGNRSMNGLFQRSSNAFIAEIRTLSAGVHTLRGRYRSNNAGDSVFIDERQFAVLLFSTTLETDFVESNVPVVVAGTTLADDSQAQVMRNISATRNLFGIYCVNKNAAVHIGYGLKIAFNLDGTDYEHQEHGLFNSTRVLHASYQSPVLAVPAGTHTVKGRFAPYYAGPFGGNATVNNRTFCLLWFSLPEAPKPPPEAFETKEVKQETTEADPAYGFTRLRVLHRVTRLVPWVV